MMHRWPSMMLQLAIVCVLLAPARVRAAEPVLTTKQLGDRLYRISGSEAGAVLVLDGDDGVLIVDTQDSTTARNLDAALARISRRPVRHVINTHYHTDHVGGNARYRARGATTYAQARVAAQAAKDTTIPEWGDWHRIPVAAAGLPMISFGDSLRLRVNGETILAFHAPAAHTDGDAVLWMPGRNLIHAGDIVEVGAAPFIDWWAGGTLDGMIAAVERMLDMSDAKTVIVPGHGDTVNRAWLVVYLDMLASLRERTRDAIARKVPRTEFLDSKPLVEWEQRLGSERGARRLAALAYYGLSGMKE